MNDAPPAASPGNAADTGPLTPGQVKALKVAIVVMGAMIVIGILVIIGRMFYLANKPNPGNASRVVASPVTSARLNLPPGAVVQSMTMEGNRLAIYYQSPTGAGIKLVDLTSGSEISHIAIEPGVPGR